MNVCVECSVVKMSGEDNTSRISAPVIGCHPENILKLLPLRIQHIYKCAIFNLMRLETHCHDNFPCDGIQHLSLMEHSCCETFGDG